MWRRKALTLGDNNTKKIKSLNPVIRKSLVGCERMSAADAKLFTIMAHRIDRQEGKKCESYLKRQDYSFVYSLLNDVFVRLKKYAAKGIIDQRKKKT